MAVFTALLHYPVYDKNNKIVCTSVTNLDIHDIARSSKTYNIEKYFIVTPLQTQQVLVKRMSDFWLEGIGSQYNTHRKEVFEIISLQETFEKTKEYISLNYPGPLNVLIPDARRFDNSISYQQVNEWIKKDTGENFLIVFGTGYGLTEEFIHSVDYILDPVYGPGDYNHLSVRSAAAIILDRILGR